LGANGSLCLNASGLSPSQLPRVELIEMGPRLDLTVRRRREAPPDLAKEAHKQPKLTGKKVHAWIDSHAIFQLASYVRDAARPPPLTRPYMARTG
jgi:hypothetical protein